jgi:hypothetical protein
MPTKGLLVLLRSRLFGSKPVVLLGCSRPLLAAPEVGAPFVSTTPLEVAPEVWRLFVSAGLLEVTPEP